jgi:hypothetical protein
MFQPYFDRVVRPAVPALRPLDRDDTVAGHELLQPEVLDFPGLEAIQIDVVERQPPRVFWIIVKVDWRLGFRGAEPRARPRTKPSAAPSSP